MSIAVKCAGCGGSFSLSTKTRRRVIYKCEKCGKELPVRKRPKDESKDTKE
jgi:DNA-directed RNA polymerase subunit RPC12/RpoP